jgi:hypothetical protein
MSKDALSVCGFLSALRSNGVLERCRASVGMPSTLKVGFGVGTTVLFVLKSDEAVDGANGVGFVTEGALSGALVEAAVDGGFILSGSASVGIAFSATIPAHKTLEAITPRVRNSLDIRLMYRSESELEKLLRLAFGFKTSPEGTTM